MSESVTTTGSIPKKIFAPGTIVTIKDREGLYITKDNGSAERIDGVPQPDGTIKMRCGKFYKRMPNRELRRVKRKV